MATIGELLLRVGLDPSSWADLKSTLEEGKADVQDFATSAQQAGDDLDKAFAAATSDATASLQELASAIDPVKQAQEELRAAFAESGVSMDTLDASSAALGSALEEMGLKTASVGTAASTTATNLEQLNQPLADTKDHAAEAGAAFEGMGESLLKMAELGGVILTMESLAEAVKDLAKESIDAFGNLQMITEGLTALTGSAEGAESILSQLKDLASQSVFSFPQLGQAAQAMAAIGVEAEAIPGAITAISDAAEVTGKSFDGVASALDRIFLTGNVSTRGLTQLGISMQDLADSMGISADQVQTVFKQMGAESEDALDILTQTMTDKVGPAAEQMSDTLKVALNSVQVEWDSLLEEFGKDLSPGIIDLTQYVKDLLPILEEVASVIAQIATSQISELASGFADLYGSVRSVVALLPDIGQGSTTATQAWKEAAANALDFVTHIKDAADFLKIVADTVNLLSGAAQPLQIQANNLLNANKDLASSLAQEQVAHDAAAAAAARHQAALDALATAAAAAQAKMARDFDALEKEEETAFDNLDKMLQKMPSDFEDFQAGLESGINFDQIDTQLTDFIATLDRTGLATTEFGANLKDQAAAARDNLEAWMADSDDLQTVFNQMVQSMQSLDKVDLTQATQGINAFFKTFQQEGEASLDNPFFDALNKLKLSVDGDTKTMTADFAAFNTVVGDTSRIDLIEGAWAKLQTSITALAKDPSGLPQIVALQQKYLDSLEAAGAPMNQLLGAQEQMYSTQLKFAEQWGATSDTITAIGEKLSDAKTRLDAFNDSSQGTLNLYNNVKTAFSSAWTEFGTGIGDAIAGTESFGQAFSKALDDMEKKLSELVVNFLLGQLKDAFIQNTDALGVFGKLFNDIFGVSTSGAANGAGGAASAAGGLASDSASAGGTVAQGSSSVASGITQMSTGIISTLSNLVNLLTGIGQLITGIISDIEQAHTNTLLDRIELSTRQTATFLGAGGGVIDYLDHILAAVVNESSAFTGWFHEALASLMTTIEDIDNKITAGAIAGGLSGGSLTTSSTSTTSSDTGSGSSSGIPASTVNAMSNAAGDMGTAAAVIQSSAPVLQAASGTISSAGQTMQLAAGAYSTTSETAAGVIQYLAQQLSVVYSASSGPLQNAAGAVQSTNAGPTPLSPAQIAAEGTFTPGLGTLANYQWENGTWQPVYEGDSSQPITPYSPKGVSELAGQPTTFSSVSTIPGAGLTGGGPSNPIVINQYGAVTSMNAAQQNAQQISNALRTVAKL